MTRRRSFKDKIAYDSAQQRNRSAGYAVVSAKFLAGDRIELTAADVIPPDDPEGGDAEYYRMRAVSVVARRLRRAWPDAEIYVSDD